MTPSIEFTPDDRLRIHFADFGLESYRLFLKAKALPEWELEYLEEDETYAITAPARFAAMMGVEAPRPEKPDLPISPFLYDDQGEVLRLFLDAKRFACWSDCGWGKTLLGLEGARHVVHRTGKRVLIFTLNEIVGEWLDEAQKFYGASLPLRPIATKEEMRRWCAGRIDGAGMIAVTNYEKCNPGRDDDPVINELRMLGAIILDEGDRLRTGGGKQKWCLIKSSKGIEYKLILTATPAPNNTQEYASQAAFLEKMRDENDIIWTYFRRNTKTHRWEVKPHARQGFFRFMAPWSIYIRDPRRYGWRQSTYVPVPDPIIIERPVDATPEQIAAATEYLARNDPQGRQLALGERDLNAIERLKLSEIAKGFCYHGKAPKQTVQRIRSLKPGVVADDAAREELDRGVPVLVWTTFDAESDILAEEFSRRGMNFAVLRGKTAAKERTRILAEYRAGKIRTLITLASLLGRGMNLQFVKAMVFSGWNDSYVAWYQALRRAVRNGQTDRVRVYIPLIEELERDTRDNLIDKEGRNFAEIELMEQSYVAAHRELKGVA